MNGSFKRIWSFLTARERKSAVVLLGFMLLGTVLETLSVGFVIPAIALLTQESLTARHPGLRPVLTFLRNPSQAQLIAGGMLALVSIYVVKAIFLAFLAWRQTRFAFGVQVQLSQRLFQVYLRQPYAFHLQRNSAQLIRNAVSEVNQFIFNGMLPGMLLLTECLVLFGLGALLFIVEPVGAVTVGGMFGLAAWGFHRATRAGISRYGETRLHHEGHRLQHLQQGLGAVKDVILLGRQNEFLTEYHGHNAQSARAAEFLFTLQQLPRLWLELLAVVGLATLVLIMVVQGRNMSTIVPTLALFGAAAFRLMPSVNRVVASVQSLRYCSPVIELFSHELALPVSATIVAGDGLPLEFQAAIYLSEVSYRYPEAATPALTDITVRIERGEYIGFIGPSGSGKSTLVDVLLGLLPASSGQVTVDGHDIRENVRSWQHKIGYVPQSIFLTDDTLRRNVAFGLPNDQIDDTAVVRAIRAAQLEEFVAGLRDGLETVVGERGVRLSGGQRQRIGIARALYHDPAILVMDEATSALDSVTEAGVMHSVTALQRSKTILVVAHRDSTVERCDRVFRLERGRLVGEGSPAEMLYSRKVV